MVANYEKILRDKLQALRNAGEYRVFSQVRRVAGRFPLTRVGSPNNAKAVTLWCTNDYLGMGQDADVIAAAKQALDEYGLGAGGSRNIGGTSPEHVALEEELASLHGKESALFFCSGYVANEGSLGTLARLLPDCVFFSDAMNHASIIHGICNSRVEKRVFRHNDAAHLDELMAGVDPSRPKIVVFESVYSMDGDIAPIRELCEVANKHSALTFLDEVHAVGLYGPEGAGVAARDGIAHLPVVVQGTLGKAFGGVGGYIAGPSAVVDAVRSFAPGFIFTTSLPPAVARACLTAVRKLRRSDCERARLHRNVALTKKKLAEAGVSTGPTSSHIIPVIIGETARCRQVAKDLLDEFSIYVQPITSPTVPRGTERLRITPTPQHTGAQIEYFVDALSTVIQRYLQLGERNAA